MYSVNGVSLESPALGWALTAETRPLSEYTRSVLSVSSPGRDGVVAGLPSSVGPVTVTLAVETPKANLEALISLFGAGGVLSVTEQPDREVRFEVLSTNYRSMAAKADEVVEYVFIIRLPGAFWRSKVEQSYTGNLDAGSVSFEVFPGLSAPVQDAVVRVGGAATGIQVMDSSGAWLTLPDVGAGEFVRFESATGRAFRTVTDTWAGGVEVSGEVDFGGPRQVFEVCPLFVDPTVRRGLLTVTTASRSGAVVGVRGKAAYLI